MKFLQKSNCLGLFLALSGASLLAAPPPRARSNMKNNRPVFPVNKQAFTLQDFWVEDFLLPNATTSDTGATAWTSSATYSKAVFGVYSNEFRVNNISVGDSGTWVSAPISITGKTNINLSATVHSAGGLENDATEHSDYIRFYYKVDNGAEVLFSDLRGIINNNSAAGITIHSTGTISGATVQIIVRTRATANDEFYYFDNITASGAAGCSESDIPVQVSASASDRLTCNVTTVTLSGSSFTAGATYSWTGPGSFSASGTTVQTGVPGTYSFTATNPTNGCSKTIPVIVAQHIALPANVAAANAGPLTCTVTETTLTGSSSSPNVSYQWDGPDGYLSFSAEDIATEAGDYILTVTNDDNGCITKDTTTVLLNCSSARKIVAAPAVITATNVATGRPYRLALTGRVNNHAYIRQRTAIQ